MELFLRAVAKYDPHYSDKLKQAVEVIEKVSLRGFETSRQWGETG
jgi:hypothetical protein